MAHSQANTQSLEISAKSGGTLSKNQKEFNRLTARIEKLRKEIVLEEEKYTVLLKTAMEHLFPSNEALAKMKMELAAALTHATTVIKLGKKQLKDIGTCIRSLYHEAFTDIVPTDEEKAAYDRWSDTSYDEELEEQQAEEQDFLEDMLHTMFGIDVDLDTVKDNPEEFFRLQEQMMDKANQGPNHGNASRQKKKSNAQQKAEEEREAKIKAAEEMKSKSVRGIYISLAKLIHPDTETDDLQRTFKEEEMKKLTAAYERNDLATLLLMEMEWIHKQNDHLGTIPDEKLALYVRVLKDQVTELEREKFQIRHDPRFHAVEDYSYGQMENGIRKIKADARKNKQFVSEIKQEIGRIQRPEAKEYLITLVKLYLTRLQQRTYFDFF